jgi:hypothetical protein
MTLNLHVEQKAQSEIDFIFKLEPTEMELALLRVNVQAKEVLRVETALLGKFKGLTKGQFHQRSMSSFYVLRSLKIRKRMTSLLSFLRFQDLYV